MNLFGLNLIEEYQFTNRSNYEVIKEVSRHIRAIEPADGPDQDSIAGLLADPYKGSSLGVGGYAIAMTAAGPALANVYDGDNSWFQVFRPDGHLDPSKKAWIKYEEDLKKYVTPTDVKDKLVIDGIEVANPSKPIQDRFKTQRVVEDLGLGKEISFTYPWNPSESPSFCKNFQMNKNLEKKLEPDTPGDYWNEDENPGTKCNEFIFSRA